MKWTQATLGQLMEIAFNDKGANPRHKILASAEISYRKNKKRQNIKYVEKR